jgi:hypothetical protein
MMDLKKRVRPPALVVRVKFRAAGGVPWQPSAVAVDLRATEWKIERFTKSRKSFL